MNSKVSLVAIFVSAVFGLVASKPHGYVQNAFGAVTGNLTSYVDVMRQDMEARMRRIEQSIGNVGSEMDRRFDGMRDTFQGFAGILRGNKFPGDIIIQMTPEDGNGNGNVDTSSGNAGSGSGIIDDQGTVALPLPGGGSLPNPISGAIQTFASIPQMFLGGKAKPYKNGAGNGGDSDVVILEEEKSN